MDEFVPVTAVTCRGVSHLKRKRCQTSADDWINPRDLPPRMAAKQREGNGTLAAAVSTAETDLLVSALHSASSTGEAARRLGISRATLWRKMKKCGVSLARVKSQ